MNAPMSQSPSAWPASRVPRFSVQIPQQDVSYQEILDIALEAEESGCDCVWLYDHFFPIIGSSEGPCLDGWTVLSALAALTNKVRLGILVTGNTYRHPSVLAKMATTADIISGGRLEFGLGGAWFELEHDALGVPFPPVRERLDRLEEALQLVRLFWTKGTEGKVDFDGRYYRLKGAVCNPKPVQTPHPPIMVGGGGERKTLRSVARHADLWNTFGPPEGFRQKISVLKEHCRAEGRNPDEIEKSVLLMIVVNDDPKGIDQLIEKTARRIGWSEEDLRKATLAGSAEAVVERIHEYHQAGVTHIIFGMVPYWDRSSFRRFTQEVMPKFR